MKPINPAQFSAWPALIATPSAYQGKDENRAIALDEQFNKKLLPEHYHGIIKKKGI